jgi:anti-sigma regulatory factor (Ser/Thr protein kinase)
MAFQAREIAVPADLARIREIRDYADQAAADFGFDDEGRYQIKLVVSEAVSNAVLHGSPGDDAEVHIRIVEEGGALTFYVSDRGTFVPRVVRDSALPESGRGLVFMGQLMDEFDVRPGRDGTVVRFAKRLNKM